MLSFLLHRIRLKARSQVQPLAGAGPAVCLVFSLSDTRSRARVLHASGADFESVWSNLAHQAQKLVEKEGLDIRWLRLDWVTGVESSSINALKMCLRLVKRNYFRYGIALDSEFKTVFLEGELNANAMLYGGGDVGHSVLNEKNFSRYAQTRFKGIDLDFSDSAPVWLLETRGIFCADDGEPHQLHGSGLETGRRSLARLGVDEVTSLIEAGSRYLATQVKRDGRFQYGWHPCFDRAINAYNALRHASTLYSMLEAWEVTHDSVLEEAIRSGVGYLTDNMIKQVTLADGTAAAFLVDVGSEIKLGGNGVCLLMLCKQAELFPDEAQLELLEQLAAGVAYMHNHETGAFVHVLNYPDLSVKEEFRVIYYEGEAVFGLMRLYGLTRDARWLALVESAFRCFIGKKHWRRHDHWLGYCASELTRHRPEPYYYEFGLRNVADYLHFVENRITTFPTLLELMMATESLLDRLHAEPNHCHLLKLLDQDAFYQALEQRARHLLNGHFWPELALYYRNPARIVGSFFIRHHAFRVRIDDVEHYLSALVAYRRYLVRTTEAKRVQSLPPAMLRASGSQ